MERPVVVRTHELVQVDIEPPIPRNKIPAEKIWVFLSAYAYVRLTPEYRPHRRLLSVPLSAMLRSAAMTS